jgi:ceramide glucosyltransferase
MEILPTIMEYTLLAAAELGLIYGLLSTGFLVHEFLKAGRALKINRSLPPVSVFKPLKGLDGQLGENLRSFFNQNYAEFELLFGVEENSDPAVEVVKKLQEEYPLVRSKLVVDARRIGANPKINNLNNLLRYASYNIFVINDSNVRVRPEYLTDLVSHLDESGVGLVTSSIRGIGGSGLGGILEDLHLNTFLSATVYGVTKMFGVPVTMGKSMCFARQTLEQLGGFRSYGDYLIEDALLGKHIKELGYKVKTSISCVDNVNSGWNLGRFWNRHLRWATLRRHLNVFQYPAEVFAHPTTLSLIYALLRNDQLAWFIFAGICVVKIGIDKIAASCVLSRQDWWQYLLIPIKELLMFAIWFAAFFKRTVEWRGNKFVLSRNTYVVPRGLEPFPSELVNRIAGYISTSSKAAGYLNQKWQRVLQNVSSLVG